MTHERTLFAAAVLAALAAAPIDLARAAEAAPATLDLSGFEGRVRLVLSATDEVRSNTDGWLLGRRRDALFVQRRQVSTFALPACGGPALAPAANVPSAQQTVEIAIPASTLLRARGFAGTLESNVALVDARLEVGSGTLQLAQLVGGELSVVGSGAATVGEAAGSLRLAVDGSGTIQVRGGHTEQLEATLNGSGLIHHDGVVRQAVLTAAGDGEIRVRQVQEPPRSEQTGRASITTACIGPTCERR